jgi:UDP-N-acetylmuramyl pentapeptide synthase
MKEKFITSEDLNLVFETNLKKLSITGAAIDSRNIKRGNIFFAIDGKHNDGHNFLQQAEKKGASIAIVKKYYLF